MCKNSEKKWCKQPLHVLPPAQRCLEHSLCQLLLRAPRAGGNCLSAVCRKGLKSTYRVEEGAGNWLAGERLRDGAKKKYFFLERPSWHKTKPHLLLEHHSLASPPQNELGAPQAQIWSTADSMILTSSCSTPGHPKHALLSRYMRKRNRKVRLSLPMWHRNGLHNCIYFGGSFWEASACTGLCVGSQPHQFSLPLFLLCVSGSLLPAQEPETPAPARPHSAL